MSELRDRLRDLDAAIIAWKHAHADAEGSATYQAVDDAQRRMEGLHQQIGTVASTTSQNDVQGVTEDAHVTYRQEYVRCGKSPCSRCDEGAGHGPYWYAYTRRNGRLVKKYIGKKEPS